MQESNHEPAPDRSFAKGFFLGQASVVLLAIIFIKYFIFGEVPETPRRRARSFSTPRRILEDDLTQQKKVSSVLRSTQPLTSAAILAKTYYNVKGHQPESLDWFNVLIAQTIAQLRTDAQQDNAILTSLTTQLNARKPDYLDEIRVTEVGLGEEFPIFSNCRVIPVAGDAVETSAGSRPSSRSGKAVDGGRLQARMDVDLSDAITIGIETKLVLNYPKPATLVMPVALAVSVVRFSGTLSISFIPSPATAPRAADPAFAASQTPTSLTFSFLSDYRLELSTRSLLGSRSRLQNVPKIAELVEAHLHSLLDDRCVEPRFQQIVLPSLWPRSKNTRGGDAVDDDVDDMHREAVVDEPIELERVREPALDGLRARHAANRSQSGDVHKRMETSLDEHGLLPSMPGGLPA